jgi:hypothetical protein
MNDSKHAPVECPRCGRYFSCKSNAPHKCDCVKVQLSREEVNYIRTAMFDEPDCLCMNCLDDLVHLHKMSLAAQ